MIHGPSYEVSYFYSKMHNSDVIIKNSELGIWKLEKKWKFFSNSLNYQNQTIESNDLEMTFN